MLTGACPECGGIVEHEGGCSQSVSIMRTLNMFIGLPILDVSRDQIVR